MSGTSLYFLLREAELPLQDLFRDGPSGLLPTYSIAPPPVLHQHPFLSNLHIREARGSLRFFLKETYTKRELTVKMSIFPLPFTLDEIASRKTH